MSKPGTPTKIVLLLLPILMMLVFLALKIFRNAQNIRIIQEDALLENLQFLAYGAGGLIAIAAGFAARRRGMRFESAVLLFLGLGLLFAGLEEINWGQRIFKIKTPAYFQRHNEQQEMNLHNLAPVHNRLHKLYVLAGSLLAFFWIPAMGLRRSRILGGRLKAAAGRLAPPWYLMTFFLPVVLFYSFTLKFPAVIQSARFLLWRDQETTETLLALGLLALAVTILLRVRGEAADVPPGP